MSTRLLVLGIAAFLSCAAFAGDNLNDVSSAVDNDALLVADNPRPDRRDGRKDHRDDKQDCRQEEGRVGDDKRECKHEEPGEGDEEKKEEAGTEA